MYDTYDLWEKFNEEARWAFKEVKVILYFKSHALA